VKKLVFRKDQTTGQQGQGDLKHRKHTLEIRLKGLLERRSRHNSVDQEMLKKVERVQEKIKEVGQRLDKSSGKIRYLTQKQFDASNALKNTHADLKKLEDKRLELVHTIAAEYLVTS
jgi:chromosome segregation ATPase